MKRRRNKVVLWAVAVNPESAQCVGVAIGGWFLVVVAAGILLKIGRAALRGLGVEPGDRD